MIETRLMLDSTDLLADPASLRQRARDEGYLYFKRLLDPARVWEVRRQVVGVLADRGLIDAGPGPGRETVIRAAVEAQPKAERIEQCLTLPLYRAVQKLEAFHALPHDPALIGLYETLFGEPVLVHPRNIARIIMPGGTFFPTPPHQDFPIIQGGLDTWTCWMPLGDVPRELGPLSLMPGSHRHGVFDTVTTPGAGATGAKIAHLPPDWVSADFEAGDVVTFHSLTVHRALPQQHADLLRLSIDARYQPASQPIHALSLRPHYASYVAFAGTAAAHPGAYWEDVYEGWSSDELKYYWRKLDLKLSGYDPGLLPFLRDLGQEERTVMKARFDDRADA